MTNRTIRILALAVILIGALAGCQNAKPPSAAEVRAWDAILVRSVAVVRASVAVQPPGDRRDKVLAIIDQVSTWEALGAAVSEAVAAGYEVRVPATRPVN